MTEELTKRVEGWADAVEKNISIYNHKGLARCIRDLLAENARLRDKRERDLHKNMGTIFSLREKLGEFASDIQRMSRRDIQEKCSEGQLRHNMDDINSLARLRLEELNPPKEKA